MRFRLRKLLILLAVLPPLIAGAWWFTVWVREVRDVDLGPFGPFAVLGLLGAILAAVATATVVRLVSRGEKRG